MEFNGNLLHSKDKVLYQGKFLIINLPFSVIQLLSSAELMIMIILQMPLSSIQTNAHGKNLNKQETCQNQEMITH